MKAPKHRVETRRNERMQLTDAERSVMDSLDAVSLAAPVVSAEAAELAELRKEFDRDSRAAFAELFPDLDERAGARLDKLRSAFDKLKGTTWPPVAAHTESGYVLTLPASSLPALGEVPSVSLAPQPAGAGEFWWAETSSFVTAPPNTLHVDIDADPNRIFGHIDYDADPTFTGNAGIVMTFMLTPDRYPRTTRQNFELRPELRTNGWVSGWTGAYHWFWAADDKWSKCWRLYQATLTLSTGETLAGDALGDNLFFLENVTGAGQANVSEVQGWLPILRFRADLADLRRRGVSMIFRAELRYDYQLEGESDIWIRHNPGSASESVPAFDNALTFRCSPGSIPTW